MSISELWRSIVIPKEQMQLSEIKTEFLKSKKQPSFQVFLNGLELTEKCAYNLPANIGNNLIVFTVRNKGNQVANDVSFSVKFPISIPGFKIQRGWIKQQTSILRNSKLEILADESYKYDISSIGQLCTSDIPSIIINRKINNPEFYFVHLRMESKGSDVFYLPFILNLIPGLKSPFINNIKDDNFLKNMP